MSSTPVAVTTRELIDLRHAAQSLVLRAGRIRALQGQNYLSPFKGRGMEFDESRPYQPGDDIRSLDWRVTARTGKPHTKLFREERERPVILAVDYRPPMFFATRGVFKSVQAARAAALLAWRATQQGDRLGGFIFSGEAHWEARPRLGAAAALHLLEQLAQRGQAPRETRSGANPDSFSQALARLRRVVRPGSLVALISDFRHLGEGGAAHLAQLARHNEVILLFIYDPLEQSLPQAGQFRVGNQQREFTLDTGNPAAREAYAQQFMQRRQQLEQLSLHYRMRLVPLSTREDPMNQLQKGLLLRT